MMAVPRIPAVRGALQRCATPLAMAVAVASLLVLGHQAARVTWLLYATGSSQPQAVDAPPPETQAPRRDTGEAAGPSVDAVVATQLFGEPAADNPEPEAPAAETQLDARLGGIYHSPKADQSIALISIDGQDTELFREGDELGANARILKIREEAVVLERQGRRERLSLVREAGQAAGTGQAPKVSEEARRTAAERQRSRPDKVPTSSLVDTTDRRRQAPGPRPSARRMD